MSCPVFACASAAMVMLILLPMPERKSSCTSTLFFSAQAVDQLLHGGIAGRNPVVPEREAQLAGGAGGADVHQRQGGCRPHRSLGPTDATSGSSITYRTFPSAAGCNRPCQQTPAPNAAECVSHASRLLRKSERIAIVSTLVAPSWAGGKPWAIRAPMKAHPPVRNRPQRRHRWRTGCGSGSVGARHCRSIGSMAGPALAASGRCCRPVACRSAVRLPWQFWRFAGIDDLLAAWSGPA